MAGPAHTPGPWRFAGFRKANNFADHTAIVQGDHCNLASVRGGVADDKAVAEANACLIAAAPTMLEALTPFAMLGQAISSGATEWTVPASDLRRAFQAYLKATGGVDA